MTCFLLYLAIWVANKLTAPIVVVTYTVPTSGDEHTVYIAESITAWHLLGIAPGLGFVFLLAHDYNRALSRMALHSFEALMFCGSFIILAFAKEIDVWLVLHAAGRLTWQTAITRLGPQLFHCLCTPLFCCIDGLRVRPGKPSKLKLIVSGVLLAYLSINYVLTRWFEDEAWPEWSKIDPCYWISGCTTLKSVYLIALSNTICYLGKIMWSHARSSGRLGLVRASYALRESAGHA
eukprot:NODE_2843_length_866_cov_372.510481.p1 GENE.NODE_2843_length_866_cov_372.510481~~NODE_2843_length_866_cov_372.510481.p1  ORF type:complete len:245 (+),score=15.30 NODE_2843_length_866_cov_372.510481:32-736(+)